MVKKSPSSVTSIRAARPARGTVPAADWRPPTAPPAVRTASDAVATADGAVRVAEAQLHEALSAVAATSAATDLEDVVDQARRRAQNAARRVHRRRRSVDDAEGALEVAAHAADRGTAGGDDVAERVAVETLERAVTAARDRLVAGEERQARAEAQLAAAEDHLTSSRDAHPRQEPARVVVARVALEKARRDLENAEEDLVQATRTTSGGRAAVTVVPEFASVDAFVEDYVLPNWRHRLVGGRWCATWWRHAEAIVRLEAVWEAFEVMRREPAPAISTWWRDHLDPHLRALTAEDGTFAGCVASNHEQIHSQQGLWRTLAAPTGTFHTDPAAPRQPRRVTHPDAKEA